jgi:mannosyltransferase OCH1-like enzyme
MIKKIHRMWFGPEPMPENYKQFGVKWQELNPDWEVIDWTEETYPTDTIINHAVIQHLRTPGPGETIHEVALATQIADVLDYELLYHFGGLYVNTDIEPLKPLSELFDRNPAMNEMAAAGWEVPGQWVVNAAMWAPEPQMEFWARTIEHLPVRYFRSPNEFMSTTTGPGLLTTMYQSRPDLLYVWERDVFNPISLFEVEYGKDAEFSTENLPEVTVGVHHWGHRKNRRPQTSKV